MIFHVLSQSFPLWFPRCGFLLPPVPKPSRFHGFLTAQKSFYCKRTPGGHSFHGSLQKLRIQLRSKKRYLEYCWTIKKSFAVPDNSSCFHWIFLIFLCESFTCPNKIFNFLNIFHIFSIFLLFLQLILDGSPNTHLRKKKKNKGRKRRRYKQIPVKKTMIYQYLLNQGLVKIKSFPNGPVRDYFLY